MGSKHEKYGYVRVGKNLYAKIRILKNRDPKSVDGYYFTGVFVKRKPRKAKILLETDLPEELVLKIRSSLLSISVS
ncbi:MAG: DUF5622 domain-containing protein [Sulfolobales archaeon]